YWMHMAHHDNPGHVGIRTKDHKLIYYYGANYQAGYRTPPAWELYDLRRDPQETKNLYDHPEYGAIASDLKEQLAALRDQVGDTGTDYPDLEAILQEFWDYDEGDRAKAVQLSHDFLATREAELAKRKKK
ncbi:MAG: sulfatase/phosphatase domain-containing protein, partial [Verrucomicrobiota bacterium]